MSKSFKKKIHHSKKISKYSIIQKPTIRTKKRKTKKKNERETEKKTFKRKTKKKNERETFKRKYSKKIVLKGGQGGQGEDGTKSVKKIGTLSGKTPEQKQISEAELIKLHMSNPATSDIIEEYAANNPKLLSGIVKRGPPRKKQQSKKKAKGTAVIGAEQAPAPPAPPATLTPTPTPTAEIKANARAKIEAGAPKAPEPATPPAVTPQQSETPAKPAEPAEPAVIGQPPQQPATAKIKAEATAVTAPTPTTPPAGTAKIGAEPIPPEPTPTPATPTPPAKKQAEPAEPTSTLTAEIKAEATAVIKAKKTEATPLATAEPATAATPVAETEIPDLFTDDFILDNSTLAQLKQLKQTLAGGSKKIYVDYLIYVGDSLKDQTYFEGHYVTVYDFILDKIKTGHKYKLLGKCDEEESETFYMVHNVNLLHFLYLNNINQHVNPFTILPFYPIQCISNIESTSNNTCYNETFLLEEDKLITQYKTKIKTITDKINEGIKLQQDVNPEDLTQIKTELTQIKTETDAIIEHIKLKINLYEFQIDIRSLQT